MIFIITITLILLYSVNEFINNEIAKIKPTTSEETHKERITKTIVKDGTAVETITEITEKNPNINSDKNAARIGFLERILYFIGIVSQNWALISIVVVFKTIARYKEIDKQIKAEYFLIGSFLSLIWAIVISVIFIAFDKIHNLGMVNYILNSVTYNLKFLN
ncbi:hypothetical protein [Arcobacter sp. F2176]|uniref:hypothetical protein n=1 Tax=Arcobacter sp. F2176 TaxID=2044511 RepID=UPI0013E94CCF|nr:hypothetical protein [Arcobacter sp. F2176]